MREQCIQIRPFDFLNIIDYKGLLELNKHGIVIVKGLIQNDKEIEYLRMAVNGTWTEVLVKDESGKGYVLFCGTVANAELESRGGVKALTLKIITGSSQMDTLTHIRSFEDEDMTVETVLNSITEKYEGGSVIVSSGYNTKLGEYLCQYEETDWQFVNRIAGRCSTVLVPNYKTQGIKYYFGLPDHTVKEIVEDNEYVTRRCDGRTSYTIKSREIYNLGEMLQFLGRKVIITRIESIMEGNELYHNYELLEEKDIIVERIANGKLTGASLRATVAGIRSDEVQLEINENEYKCNVKRWFPFATIYSSLDGTGWYCMPEQGDCVRLYFPSSEEAEAFVLNAVHLESANMAERIRPECKSIMNKYGKEILLTPTSLILTNNDGMSVELSDTKGITIISDKEIEIKSEEGISMTCIAGKIDLSAQEAVTLQQGNTSMVLSDKLKMQGARVKLE